MNMRAIVLREPWLYLMLDIEDPELRKNVENRGRRFTRHLGPILVKSSVRKPPGRKGIISDEDYYESQRKRVAGWGLFPMELFPSFNALTFGTLRGALNFSQILTPNDRLDLAYRWKFPTDYGYVVDRHVRFAAPRQLRDGGQGIFYVETTPSEDAQLAACGMVLPQ